MTTTKPIPAWINVEAIVTRPELKVQADAMAEAFRTKYQELFEMCNEAVDLMKRLSLSEPEEVIDELMADANPLDRGEVADASWKIFHELNGYGPLFRSISALADMLKVASECGDMAEVNPEVSK